MRAAVAYESTAEARRKLKALKPLRWHRTASGLEAKGARGKYVLVQRSPDRRHGVFPWSLRQGGAKGPEIKIGGFDLVAEGKDFATLFDAGLCGAPPQPEGVYRGTVAGEAGNSAYARKVSNALMNMGVDANMVDSSEDYLRRMEVAGLDPVIVASVLVATKEHLHVHDCPEKHVELSEAGEARRKKRGLAPDDWMIPSLQQRLDQGQPGFGSYPTVSRPPGSPEPMFYSIEYLDTDYNEVVSTGVYANSADAAVTELYRRTPTVDAASPKGQAAFKVWSVVNGQKQLAYAAPPFQPGASETKKRLPQPDPSTGYFITHSSLTRDLWLMHENTLVARSTDRGELLKKAEQLSSGASENRRPKG